VKQPPSPFLSPLIQNHVQVFKEPLLEQAILRPHNVDTLFSNLDDIIKVSDVSSLLRTIST